MGSHVSDVSEASDSAALQMSEPALQMSNPPAVPSFSGLQDGYWQLDDFDGTPSLASDSSDGSEKVGTGATFESQNVPTPHSGPVHDDTADDNADDHGVFSLSTTSDRRKPAKATTAAPAQPPTTTTMTTCSAPTAKAPTAAPAQPPPTPQIFGQQLKRKRSESDDMMSL